MKIADAAPTPTATTTHQGNPDERPWFDEPLDDDTPPVCLDDPEGDDGLDDSGGADLDGSERSEKTGATLRRPRIWPPYAVDEDCLDAAAGDAMPAIPLVHVDLWTLIGNEPNTPLVAPDPRRLRLVGACDGNATDGTGWDT